MPAAKGSARTPLGSKFLNAGKSWPHGKMCISVEPTFSDTTVKALQATKNVMKYEEAKKEHSALRKV